MGVWGSGLKVEGVPERPEVARVPRSFLFRAVDPAGSPSSYCLSSYTSKLGDISTLGRCPLSIFCPRDTPPTHTPVDVMDENPLSQPTLSLSPSSYGVTVKSLPHTHPAGSLTPLSLSLSFSIAPSLSLSLSPSQKYTKCTHIKYPQIHTQTHEKQCHGS